MKEKEKQQEAYKLSHQSCLGNREICLKYKYITFCRITFKLHEITTRHARMIFEL